MSDPALWLEVTDRKIGLTLIRPGEVIEDDGEDLSRNRKPPRPVTKTAKKPGEDAPQG